jgi:hypothetical protein
VGASDDRGNFKPYEEWKPGDDDDERPAKKFSDVPITDKDGQPVEILLIGGDLSGRRMQTRSLENWELIHCHGTDRIYAYQQDKPGSHNYYFHKAKTAWLEENRESFIAKVGSRFRKVFFVEDK